MAEIAPDTIIDSRYRVMQRLGTGGMADVFLVEDQQLGRKVALKLLHRRFAEDPAFVERFRREAQAAAGLQHQNIVSVYDRGEWDGTYYIAMEYLAGRTLKQVIREEAPLDPVRAIDIAIQILKAASFAHRRGIVHRDLKPHNVMVDDAGNATVTDFGIARAGASDMTETGSIMGTAQYLSPEQAQGHSVNASSDLYSVGIVLYEMLTGRVPFDGEAAVTIALKHVSEAPIPPREINPEIPPELEQTVLWTLNKNPADRPADADQLITVLEHCREAIIAGAAGENTASMAALAAGAAAGMPVDPAHPLPEILPAPAPSTTSSGQIPVVVYTNGNGAPPEEEQGSQGWRPWLYGLLVLLLVLGAAAAAYFLSRPKQVTVPSVVSDRLSVATTALQNAGFTVGTPIYVRNPKPSGVVIGESPAGGEKADKGSTVTLKVSQGRGDVTIPSVLGETKAKATKDLKAAGLKIARYAVEASTKFADGQVIGTNPGSGQSVPRGEPVTVLVSSGVPMVAVPSVVGNSRAQAIATLNNSGFKVTTQYETSSSTAGDVLSQNPVSGKDATKGSHVTITVAKAPTKVKVPSVTNDTQDGAESALRAAGFVPEVENRTVTDPTRVGTVVAQSPTSGSRQTSGSTVVITVGVAAATSSTSTTTTTTTTTTSATPTTSSSSSTTATPGTNPVVNGTNTNG